MTFNYVSLRFPNDVFYIIDEISFKYAQTQLKNFPPSRRACLKRIFDNASHMSLPSDIDEGLKDRVLEFYHEGNITPHHNVMEIVHTAGRLIIPSLQIDRAFEKFQSIYLNGMFNVDIVLTFLKRDYKVGSNEHGLAGEEILALNGIKTCMLQQKIMDDDFCGVKTLEDIEKVLRSLLFSNKRIMKINREIKNNQEWDALLATSCAKFKCIVCPCFSVFIISICLYFSIASQVLVEEYVLGGDNIDISNLFNNPDKILKIMVSRSKELSYNLMVIPSKIRVAPVVNYMSKIRDKRLDCSDGLNLSICAMRDYILKDSPKKRENIEIHDVVNAIKKLTNDDLLKDAGNIQFQKLPLKGFGYKRRYASVYKTLSKSSVVTKKAFEYHDGNSIHMSYVNWVSFEINMFNMLDSCCKWRGVFNFSLDNLTLFVTALLLFVDNVKVAKKYFTLCTKNYAKAQDSKVATGVVACYSFLMWNATLPTLNVFSVMAGALASDFGQYGLIGSILNDKALYSIRVRTMCEELFYKQLLHRFSLFREEDNKKAGNLLDDIVKAAIDSLIPISAGLYVMHLSGNDFGLSDKKYSQSGVAQAHLVADLLRRFNLSSAMSHVVYKFKQKSMGKR